MRGAGGSDAGGPRGCRPEGVAGVGVAAVPSKTGTRKRPGPPGPSSGEKEEEGDAVPYILRGESHDRWVPRMTADNGPVSVDPRIEIVLRANQLRCISRCTDSVR